MPVPIDTDAIARDARFGAGEHAFFTQKRVDEGGLARIRAAHNCQTQRTLFGEAFCFIELFESRFAGFLIIEACNGGFLRVAGFGACRSINFFIVIRIKPRQHGIIKITKAYAMFSGNGDGFAQPQAPSIA